jgi:hypothetical protein
MSREAACIGKIDRGRDGGMGGGAQEQQLSDAEPQHIMDGGRTRRQGRRKAMGDEGVNLPETTQNRRHEQAGEGPIANRQRLQVARLVDRIVQGTPAP